MTDQEIEVKANELFEAQIRPALAGHGGDAKIVSVKDGVVSVELQGGCRGCSGARATMKNGIEKFLKESISEVKEVVDVTDHSA